MTIQPDLFTPVSKPNVLTTVSPSTKDDICKKYHKGNPMSVAANKIAHKGKIGARQLILEALKADITDWKIRGAGSGLTCEEIERYTELSHQTCSAKISDLKRDGLIIQVGTRKTRSGCNAAVYQAK